MITKFYVRVLCVAGGARGLGAAVGKPQWHPICRHILAEGGHRKRAIHTRPTLQGQRWSDQEATGDEIRPYVVLPSRTSRLRQWGSAKSTGLLQEPCLCLAACWGVEVLPEVSSRRRVCGSRTERAPLQIWLPPPGITCFTCVSYYITLEYLLRCM